jgi:hypothetical protein
MSEKIDNLAKWATTASEGDYVSYYSDMTAEDIGCEHSQMAHDTCAECGETCSTHDVICADDRCPIHGTISTYLVTFDASGGRAWEGSAQSCDEALSQVKDSGSRCGWSDSELDGATRVLRRRGLTLDTDDRGILVARIDADA